MPNTIIAEIGINHNGDMGICKELIDVAKNAGADCVKFQKRDINKVYTKDFLDSPRESPWGKTQRKQKLGLEFDASEYQEISDYCKLKEINPKYSIYELWLMITQNSFPDKISEDEKKALLTFKNDSKNLR